MLRGKWTGCQEGTPVRRRGDQPKRVWLGRASLLAAFTTVLLAAGYGFAVLALTRAGDAGAGIAGASSAPEVSTTFFTTTTKERHKKKCNGHANCHGTGGDTGGDGVFLCYSNSQAVPGVWPEK